jgi:hypothetical protein
MFSALKTYATMDEFLWNLVCTLWQWRPPNLFTFSFPTINITTWWPRERLRWERHQRHFYIILILSSYLRIGLPSGLLLRLSDHNFVSISHLSHGCYISRHCILLELLATAFNLCTEHILSPFQLPVSTSTCHSQILWLNLWNRLLGRVYVWPVTPQSERRANNMIMLGGGNR